MTRTYTVAELISRCRTKGNYESSNRLTDAKWIQVIEEAYGDLRDELISKFGEDYFTKRTTGNFVVDQENYSLPSDFLKLLGVDVKYGGEWRQIHRLNLHERNAFQNGATWGAWADHSRYRYRIEGSEILIQPIPAATDEYRLIYIPMAPKISGTSDTIEGFNGWERLIVLYALREMKRSQNEPLSDIVAAIETAERKLSWAADGRDAGEPMSIMDLEVDG